MAKKKTPAPEILELDYQLAELPSSQHRAGLAGLVLMIRWLERVSEDQGICELTRFDEYGATLRINEIGMEKLFDEVYAASREEQARPQPLKNKQKEIVPYLREEKQQTLDPKTGKTKEKVVYIYEVVVPRGAFLLDFDSSADGKNGVWIKLWRDMVWSILRGVPKTRRPFEVRAAKLPSDDASKVWSELTGVGDSSVDLPSTYFVGAQANNAENVPFKDRTRYQFLLHFWPFVAQIYVPAMINNEGERNFVGYAIAVPDVANLGVFCDEFPVVLKGRGTEISGYRPRDSVIDLAVESALDLMRRLRERLTLRTGEERTGDLVLGVDVFHVEKQGNNVRLLGSARLNPEATMIDKYGVLRRSLRNPLFRRQRLINLVNQQSWFAGFDAVLCTLPYERTLGDKTFRHDARESFPSEVKSMSDQQTDTLQQTSSEGFSSSSDAANELSEEALVYRLVGVYLASKLMSKHGIEWRDVKGDPSQRADYEMKRGKLAREAFLAVRSRTGQDFVDYFVSTLCSVAQSMSEPRFIALTKALLDDTDKIRTLTMLALSARS
ncbi:MAG: type I-MYXAN CRISPR-associated protein Cmx8 [Blastocatellales bacterium]|nr:type I-MYXAN CRISPR-associated protein Cmx8 [Blastocatellales bacterium]